MVALELLYRKIWHLPYQSSERLAYFVTLLKNARIHMNIGIECKCMFPYLIPFLASRRLCCSLAASICSLRLSRSSLRSAPSDAASASEPALFSGLRRFSTFCERGGTVHSSTGTWRVGLDKYSQFERGQFYYSLC